MSAHWWDLTYSRDEILGKDVFIFVNHKVAVLCWAILKDKFELCDVITFDSHRDYHEGVILQQDVTNESLALPAEKRCFSSRYYRDFPHFANSREFRDWNPLDRNQNSEIIAKQHKYFTAINDNFIDVAFMKGIIRNVCCLYWKTRNKTHPGKCDDVLGEDHMFTMSSIEDFISPNQRHKFIVDIDLDFFVKYDYESDNPGWVIMPEHSLKHYLSLIRSLAKQANCLGITIALEPDSCGSDENCLKICEYISEAFAKDIVSVSRALLRVNCRAP
jgi:hypothetical protein